MFYGKKELTTISVYCIIKLQGGIYRKPGKIQAYGICLQILYLDTEEAMERTKGRPESAEGRLQKEIRVYDLLDSLGIEYERIDHAPAMTMEICEQIDASLGAAICKNLFLCNRQQTDFYLLMMPGNKPFKTKDISAQIGSSRLSFGTPEFMEEFLDITPGSLSLLGLMNDSGHRVRLLIDEELMREEYIGCHPCINTSSLKIRTSDIRERLIPALGHAPVFVKL